MNRSLYSIAPTSDGGYIATGYTGSYPNDDGWVTKLDASGNQLWSKTSGGAGEDYFQAVAPTSDGGYIATGTTDSFGAGYSDGWVIKLDASGNQLWSKTSGGAGEDYFQAVAPTTDGGYLTSGHTNSFGAPYRDGWVIKLDANGNQSWSKTFGSGNYGFLYSIAPTSDGGYITAGEIYLYVTGDNNGWVIKMDANGDTGPNPPLSKERGGTKAAPATQLLPLLPPFRRPEGH